MIRSTALFLIALIFGGGIGFVTAAAYGITFDGHDHGDPTHHGVGHDKAHDTPLSIPSTNAPTLAVIIKPDPMTGHNLHVMTDNFTFAPEAASLDHVDAQGHAHVYINGKKHSRLYGPWLHLADLPQGTITLKVTLNSNDHRAFSVDGKAISATTTFSNP